jgi:hypothetical protein
MVGGYRLAEGALQDQLFEGPAAGEAQRARAQAADGPCRQFEHGGSGRLPRLSMRSSACTGPQVRPSARAACPAVAMADARTGPGSWEGVKSSVSS